MSRPRFSDVVGEAVKAALYAYRNTTNEELTEADCGLSAQEWYAMYHGQCAATDRWAKLAEAKADKALLGRIAELEQQIATLNLRIIQFNEDAMSKVLP